MFNSIIIGKNMPCVVLVYVDKRVSHLPSLYHISYCTAGKSIFRRFLLGVPILYALTHALSRTHARTLSLSLIIQLDH